MNDMKKNTSRKGEQGNVLFLILIAVALFAALSYAVTQSSRSGGGDANNETNLISSAQIAQYPASVRTSIIRMIVSNNVEVTQLNFDPPSAFGVTCDAAPGDCVFHPQGGGATYVNAPGDIMDNTGANADGRWHYSANYEVRYVGGSTTTSPDGNEIIAFLPDIKPSICAKINSELNVSGDTSMTADLDPAAAAQYMGTGYTIPNETDIIGTAGGAAAFDGQAFGCITDGGGDHIYYHVLVER